jgi:fructokinase
MWRFGLALLGRRVEFLTWIGDDRRGRRIADYLHDSGVDLAECSVGATRTATARAELDEKGSATYQFDIEWQLSPKPGLMAPLVLHTGSIATALEPGCDAVAELIDANVATSTISFDPNTRPAFFEAPNRRFPAWRPRCRTGPPAIGRPTASPGTERSASSWSRNHSLSGTT